MKLLRKTFVLFLFLVLAGMVWAGGQQDAAASGEAASEDVIKPATYSWTAGGMGGGWYTTAGGMSAIINEVEPAITIKVIPGGGMANPLKLAARQDDIGWGVSFVDKAAYNGTAPLFDKAFNNFYGLAGNFSVDYYHFLAAKNTGVTELEQFVEKVKNGEKIKIAAPMAGTSERALTTFVLEYYGLSYEAIEEAGGKVIYAVYGDMVNLYKDRHVDYVFTCLGLPGAAITEMAISRPSTLMHVTDEVIDYCNKTFGTVALDSGVSFVPGGTYKGMDEDIQTIGHSTEICASETLPDIVAYTFVKTLMEELDQVHALSPSFKKYFSKENAPKTVVPLHPGAERYYREAGLID
jgi:hypothetical protein